eukprot:Awhi_evm1s4861
MATTPTNHLDDVEESEPYRNVLESPAEEYYEPPAALIPSSEYDELSDQSRALGNQNRNSFPLPSVGSAFAESEYDALDEVRFSTQIKTERDGFLLTNDDIAIRVADPEDSDYYSPPLAAPKVTHLSSDQDDYASPQPSTSTSRPPSVLSSSSEYASPQFATPGLSSEYAAPQPSPGLSSAYSAPQSSALGGSSEYASPQSFNSSVPVEYETVLEEPEYASAD